MAAFRGHGRGASRRPQSNPPTTPAPNTFHEPTSDRDPRRSTIAVGGVAACSSDRAPNEAAQAGPGTATVTIETFEFQPDPITIDAGQTVVFVNRDAIDHTVTAGTRDSPTPDVFDGQLAEKDATFDLRLTKPGIYEYFCAVHPGPGMTGVVEVR